MTRVAVGARLLGEGTGVSTYARTLVAAVRDTGRDVEPVRAGGGLGAIARGARALSPWPARLRPMGDGLAALDLFRIAQQRFTVTGRITRVRAPGPPGIAHWTYPVPLAIAGWANLYTVHDVIPLIHPELTPINPRRHARLLRAVAGAAARLVAVSEAGRADLLRALPVAPERVVDCGQALLPPEIGDLPPTLHSRAYLLFCGRIEPRKNLARLLEAHAASGTALPLVLAGPVAEGGATILADAARRPGVAHLGYLPRPALAAAIAHARALLLPSLAEGFGLPVAEAMALGTPALVSRDLALLETAGGAALAVNGTDVAAMAAAIRRLGDDDALCADLRARGIRRAEAFTVARFAARLDRLYREVERVGFAGGDW